MGDLAEDIGQQEANIEDAENAYEESQADADRQYEENEADAQRRYDAAEAAARAADAPADPGQSWDTSDTTGSDQSSASNDQQGTNQQDNQASQDTAFDGLDKAFDQAFQNALDGTVAPDAIDQALQNAFDKALQEAPPTSADDAYRGLAASLLDALNAQGGGGLVQGMPSLDDIFRMPQDLANQLLQALNSILQNNPSLIDPNAIEVHHLLPQEFES